MSNQTNVYPVEARALYERDAREVDLQQPANLIQPSTYMPLLQRIRLELERAEDEDEYDDAFDEVEDLLPFDGDSGFGGPGIDFAARFDAGWALIEDIQTLAPFVGVPLRQRLADEDIIDGAGSPEGLDTSSPLRLLGFPGWQFFDGSEVDSMLGAVREALEQEMEILYEDEWRELAADWKTKNYDFALYRWVI